MDTTFIDKVLGSGIPYITYAVPVFFLLIGVELVVAHWMQKGFYRFNDSINDLSCGITEQIVGVFLKGLLFAGYLFLYEKVTTKGINLVDVTTYTVWGKALAALILFLGVDCAYYWFHRIAHEMNAPWAGHVVHHSSEDYNLAVALRQGTFQGVFSWVFYLPLALVGFPPLWFAAMSSFDTLYQFWIHTRTIGKLGPLEWVLNTPSHHRVHHARNPKYLDRNYAGTLIIWDRMFGTFQEEEEEPVYGLTKPLNSWNPLWANFHVWADLWRDAWRAPYWFDKLRIWFMPQGWRPRGLAPNPPAPEVTRANVIRYNAKVPLGLNVYVFLHFTITLVAAVQVLVMARQVSRWELAAPAVLVLFSLLNIGAIFEHKRWAPFAEALRLALLGTAVTYRYADSASLLPIALGAIAIGMVSVAWLWVYRQQFDGAPQALGRVITPPHPAATFLSNQEETAASAPSMAAGS